MKYFKFEIPEGLHYPPGWFGEMAKCPEDVEVLLCNDKECYGIARTPDKKLPGEVKEIKEKEANKLLSSLREEEGVYFGESLKDRQEWLPEAEVKDIEEEPGEGPVPAEPVAKKACFCSICHKFITYLPENIHAAKITITCPDGHKVVLNGR